MLPGVTRYGPWQTLYERFARWERDGTCAHLLEWIQARDDSVGAVDRTVSVDSTINRSHQHAAGARKKGAGANSGLEGLARSADDQGLGRSRGGLTTKVHLACDGRGLPVRQILRRRGIRAVIPERTDRRANRQRRGRGGGRPPTFDPELYKARNVVERCFSWLKQFRAVATRFDKLATRHRAGLHIASLILWLRQPAQERSPDTA